MGTIEGSWTAAEATVFTGRLAFMGAMPAGPTPPDHIPAPRGGPRQESGLGWKGVSTPFIPSAPVSQDPRPPNFDDDETLLAVYDEMRVIARRRVRQYGADSLQPTELANEAYTRFGKKGHRWSNRSHLLRIAARTMRDVLVERARRKASLKRGGDWERVDWESAARVAVDHPDELIMLDEAMERLDEESPEAAEVVRLKFFAGLTSEEAASILEISRRSVERRWAFARAWLYRILAED